MTVLACVNKGVTIFLQSLGKAGASTALSMLREIVCGVGLPLLLPAFLHGCYDFIATMESMHYGWLFVGFVAILFLIAFLLVKRQSKHDRYINNYDAEYL